MQLTTAVTISYATVTLRKQIHATAHKNPLCGRYFCMHEKNIPLQAQDCFKRKVMCAVETFTHSDRLVSAVIVIFSYCSVHQALLLPVLFCVFKLKVVKTHRELNGDVPAVARQLNSSRGVVERCRNTKSTTSARA